jgi:hypothetical protein
MGKRIGYNQGHSQKNLLKGANTWIKNRKEYKIIFYSLLELQLVSFNIKMNTYKSHLCMPRA